MKINDSFCVVNNTMYTYMYSMLFMFPLVFTRSFVCISPYVLTDVFPELYRTGRVLRILPSDVI
jgi:hypothetical protein